MRKLLVVINSLFVLLAIPFITPTLAHAEVDPDYMSWEIMSTMTVPNPGEVPFRRGYYDGDKDQGFGLDKLEHKHGITNPDLVEWIIRNDPNPTRVRDDDSPGTGLTALRFHRVLTTRFCLPNPYTGEMLCNGNPAGPFDMMAVVEDAEWAPQYWDGLGSVKPDPANPGTEVDNHILEGASYVEDEQIIGLLTCYQIGQDGKVDPDVQYWERTDQGDTMWA